MFKRLLDDYHPSSIRSLLLSIYENFTLPIHLILY